MGGVRWDINGTSAWMLSNHDLTDQAAIQTSFVSAPEDYEIAVRVTRAVQSYTKLVVVNMFIRSRSAPGGRKLRMTSGSASWRLRARILEQIRERLCSGRNCGLSRNFGGSPAHRHRPQVQAIHPKGSHDLRYLAQGPSSSEPDRERCLCRSRRYRTRANRGETFLLQECCLSGRPVVRLPDPK